MNTSDIIANHIDWELSEEQTAKLTAALKEFGKYEAIGFAQYLHPAGINMLGLYGSGGFIEKVSTA